MTRKANKGSRSSGSIWPWVATVVLVAVSFGGGCSSSNSPSSASGGASGGAGALGRGGAGGLGGTAGRAGSGVGGNGTQSTAGTSGTVAGASGRGGAGNVAGAAGAGTGGTNCGMPGTPCCAGKTCGGGGCCLNGYCIADGTTCMNSGSTTNLGVCQGGRCPCGNAGELCCSDFVGVDGACSNFELVCVRRSGSAVCQPCGKKDEPCCGRACTEAGTECILDKPNTLGPYSCRTCGGNGQHGCPSAPGGETCRDGLGCNSGTQVCEPCGTVGAPCCAGLTCTTPGTACNTSSVCQPCGVPGPDPITAGPCCPGNLCMGGCCLSHFGALLAVCVSGGTICDVGTGEPSPPKCEATTASCTKGTTSCGGIGQACCTFEDEGALANPRCAAPGSRCIEAPSGSATPYVCVACGGKGQPCCLDLSDTTLIGCKVPYLCTRAGNAEGTCTEPATAARR